MKVIFLDFDGVLNSINGYSDIQIVSCFKIDPECMDRLNQIIDQTDAKIVISSAWRCHYNMEELQEILDDGGLKGEIIDVLFFSLEAFLIPPRRPRAGILSDVLEEAYVAST